MKFLFGNNNFTISLLEMDIIHEEVVKGSEEYTVIQEYKNICTAGKSFESCDLIGPDLNVYYINRGGGFTIHSTGQLVLYPIINLKKRGISVHQFVFLLEQWMIDVLAELGINSNRSDKGVGVWVNQSKIGFVGIRIERGVSKHGICLNISNDLTQFAKIVPCGLKNIKITSIKNEISKNLPLDTIIDLFIAKYFFHN